MAELFLRVLNMAMTAGYCVLVILLLRLLLRRVPKIYSYVLWSVVCFRLVCPASLQSPFSLVRIDPQVISQDLIAGETKRGDAVEPSGYSAALQEGAALQRYGMTAQEGAALPYGVTSLEDGALRPDTALGGNPGEPSALISGDSTGELSAGGNPVRATPGISGGERVQPDVTAADGALAEPASQPSGAGGSPAQLLLSAAGWIWITVAATLLFYHFWQLLRLKRQLASARAVGDGIYEAENLQTAFVAGTLEPRIYLPESLPGRERRYVLAHERTHIRRRDYLVKQGAFALACVYWFHPLIWLAFYLMCRDMEMSCDECVIREMGGEAKREYSASLLSLASGRQILAGGPLAFGEGGIRARITNVLSYRRPKGKAGTLLAVLLAAVLAGLSLNPVAKADERGAGTPIDAEIRLAAADMTIRTADGRQLVPELWMTEGKYDGAEKMYAGSCELRVTDEQGETVFSCGLKELWGEKAGEEDAFRFPKEFDLNCADYNGDGRMDFTVGQAGDASQHLFLLLTVREDGVIEPLCETKIPTQETEEFSMVFRHDTETKGKPFVTYLRDDVTGETRILRYCWNESTGRYVEEGTAGAAKLPETDAAGASVPPETGDAFLEPEGITGQTDGAEDAAAGMAEWSVRPAAETAAQAAGEHRPGFTEPVLHLYVPESVMATGYVDLTGMPQEEYEVYAVQALRELYDLTGTQMEECYYFYYDNGGYVFALTKDDMDRGREFYMRCYSERVDGKFWGIESMDISYARRVWYSPVYQYDLPADFDTYDEEEKAVWFLTNSGAYNGRQIQQCFRPYDDMPKTWRIIMDDDTAYELTLDTKIDAVTNLTGPYPDSDIRH